MALHKLWEIIQHLYALGVPVKTIFVGYLGSTGIMLFNTAFVIPKHKCKKTTTRRFSIYPDVTDASVQRLATFTNLPDIEGKLSVPQGYEWLQSIELYPVQNDIYSTSTTQSFRKTIASCEWAWHTIWFTVLSIRYTYLIGTLNPFLFYIAVDGQKQVAMLTYLLGLLQLMIFAIAPLPGLIMDSKSESQLFQAIIATTIPIVAFVCMSLFVLVHIPEIQIISFTFFVIGRVFVSCAHGSMIALLFPPEYYGRLFGLGYLIAGIGALLNYPLFNLTQVLPERNPIYVDCILLGVVLISHGYPILLWRKLNIQCKGEFRKLDET
uniref:Solute carrier family 43 member 3-like n=1 Tax=Saccoglossus kowalevskii TaxID=10224 RepID=A0ABM0M2C8_SACKO|nr:PREDICTED: solute carrier family 43 member 3-like [Saccoglossus kowalevskii]